MSFPSFTFIQGEYVLDSCAKVSIWDLSVMRGYGLFATIRAYKKEPFHWKDHLLRLQEGSKHLGISLPYTAEEFYSIMKTLLEKNRLSEATLKIVVTAGISGSLDRGSEPTILVACTPMVFLPNHYYEEGVFLSTLPYERYLPQIKTTYYLPAIWEKTKKPHIFEALYLSSEEHLLEAATSNFFAVKKGVIITPKEKVLLGVTREIILSLVSPHYRIEERPISYKELEEVDEIFLTATNKEVLPVRQLDEKQFLVGPVTLHVSTLLKEYIQKREWIYQPFPLKGAL